MMYDGWYRRELRLRRSIVGIGQSIGNSLNLVGSSRYLCSFDFTAFEILSWYISLDWPALALVSCICPLTSESFLSLQVDSQWRKVRDLLEDDERCSRLEKIDRLEVYQVCCLFYLDRGFVTVRVLLIVGYHDRNTFGI